MSVREQIRNQHGMTLIEVLVSLGILSIILLTVLLSLEDGQVTSLNSARRNQAIGIATTIAEEIKDKDPTLYGTSFTVNLPSQVEGDSVTNAAVTVPAATNALTPVQTIIMQKFRCEVSATPYSGATSTSAFQYDVKVFLGTTKQLADVQFVVSAS